MSNSKQSEKFKEAAKEAECDPDEKRWEERLKRVAKAGQDQTPVPRDPVLKKANPEKPE